MYRIFRETARKIGDDANLIRNLPKLPGRIFSVSVSPDGSRIAAASTLDGSSEIRVWAYDFDGTLDDQLKKILAKRVADRNAKEKEQVEAYRKAEIKELARLSLDHAACYAVRFSRTNELFVAASDGNVRRIDAQKGDSTLFSFLPESSESDAQNAPFDANDFVVEQTKESESDRDDVATASIAKLEVHPTSISLDSPYAYCQLVVTATTDQGEKIDVTRVCEIDLPETVVATPQAVLRPTADASETITVSFGGQQATIDWETHGVSATDEGITPGAVDFIRDVNPVLSRLGCNQGTCHGAQKGKNGFKMSLRGYDPIFDLRALTDDMAARRINAAAPEQSLMLQKPLGNTPHEGGVLMTEGDPYHAILRRWIADGSHLDLDSIRVERLEIYPQNPVVQSIGSKQQVRLIAHYRDGSQRDVTREAFIESGNSEVATAAKGGTLESVRRGEAAILARYEGNYAATTLTVMGDRSGYQEPKVDAWSKIDELVAQKWKRVKVTPSPLCDDTTFLRRVTLDLIGLPPTSDEIRAFLNDRTPTKIKRERAIDRLLQSGAYVDYWTNKWADLLQVNRKFLGVEGSKSFRDWIRNSVMENQPYDDFAREILTATGSNKDNPPASYFKVLRVPEDTMENTTHLFLGIRFNCNKCHDHPFERWTQDQYYEMAAFFGRVGLETDPASGNKRIGGTAVEGAKPLYEKVVDKKSGEIEHARTGDLVQPAFPYDVECDLPHDGTRRQQLATWMTASDNPYFARSFVNRLWGYLMGVGLIEPIDDIRAGNPPTNPELLDHLTKQFIDSGFDRRQVLRQICSSRTYQLGVETHPMNEDDQQNYSHATPRRLPAEVIYDAVHALTGAAGDIPGMPKGTRATALTDSGVKLKDGFLQNLGRPVRESACECERSSELQLGPIMALIGGPTVASAIADPKNALESIVADHPNDRKLAEEIFLRSLGRAPSEAEFAAFDQIKQQIKVDHERLMKQLKTDEANWTTAKADLEKSRLENLEEAEQMLAKRIEAAKPEQARLAKERETRIAAAEEKLKVAKDALTEKATAFEKSANASVEWHPLRPTKLSATNKATLIAQPDRSILASGSMEKGVYTVNFQTHLPKITGFRLETLSDPALPAKGPGLPANGNFVITELELHTGSLSDPKTLDSVTIASAKADFTQQAFNINATFNGQKRGQGGWAVAGATGVDHWATFKLKTPIENTEGSVLRFQIHQFHNAKDHRLGRFRISITTDEGDLPLDLSEGLRSVVSTPATQRTEQDTSRLLEYVGKTDKSVLDANTALANARKPVPRDADVVRIEKRRDKLNVATPDDPRLVRLREDAKFSAQQVANLRLTAAEDLTWALINSPAFLFNH